MSLQLLLRRTSRRVSLSTSPQQHQQQTQQQLSNQNLPFKYHSSIGTKRTTYNRVYHGRRRTHCCNSLLSNDFHRLYKSTMYRSILLSWNNWCRLRYLFFKFISISSRLDIVLYFMRNTIQYPIIIPSLCQSAQSHDSSHLIQSMIQRPWLCHCPCIISRSFL